MKRNRNLYTTLHQSSRRRDTKSFLILIAFILVIIGITRSFMFSPTFGIIMQKRFFKSEEFDRIDEFGITDGNGYIEFLDSNLNVVYPKNSSNTYTKNDLNNMVNIYCVDQKVDKYHYIKDEQVYTEIISWISDDNNGWFLKVDENLNYIDSANFLYLKEKYTQKEIDYILNEYVLDARNYKYNFTSNSGKDYTMVMSIDKRIELFELYEIAILGIVFLLLLFLYIFFTSFFIRATSKKIKKPLIDLTNALNNFTNGEYFLIDKKYNIDEFNTIVSAFNHMVKTLKTLEIKNKNLEDEKKAMLANISHDLKTPITIILGYADVLKNKKLSDKDKKEYVDKIYKKSDLLTDLINEFANYNKLNHPDFKLALKEKNLCDIVRNYFISNYNYITDNEFELIVDIPEENFVCNIDEINFQRCLENLLSNFIKYNKKSTTIHISIQKHAKYYELILENNGSRIDDALAKNLFEPLIMGDESRHSNGSGLGLSATKKIITLHGGNIQYKSNNQYTNSFVIHLPTQ